MINLFNEFIMDIRKKLENDKKIKVVVLPIKAGMSYSCLKIIEKWNQQPKKLKERMK